MSQVKYGKLSSWDEGDVSSPSDFMNLKEGDNVVRIFTAPYQFHVAWIKDASGVNRKLRSAAENCPLVRAGHKIQARWYVGAIDRTSGNPKILEISSQVYTGIRGLVSDSDWGPVEGYDINIKRGPRGSQPLYTVLPKRPRDLTSEEREMIARFQERVDIGKFTQPPTAQEVAEKLGVVTGDAPPQVAVGNQTVAATGVKPTLTDEDFDFGDDEL